MEKSEGESDVIRISKIKEKKKKKKLEIWRNHESLDRKHCKILSFQSASHFRLRNMNTELLQIFED